MKDTLAFWSWCVWDYQKCFKKRWVALGLTCWMQIRYCMEGNLGEAAVDKDWEVFLQVQCLGSKCLQCVVGNLCFEDWLIPRDLAFAVPGSNDLPDWQSWSAGGGDSGINFDIDWNCHCITSFIKLSSTKSTSESQVVRLAYVSEVVRILFGNSSIGGSSSGSPEVIVVLGLQFFL